MNYSKEHGIIRHPKSNDFIVNFKSWIYACLQCYHDTSQVTDELVQAILLPGLEPGAVDVFLEFICYSAGPLPEELLPQVKVILELLLLLPIRCCLISM